MYSLVSQLSAQKISSAGRLLRSCVAVLSVGLAALSLPPTSRALLPPPPPDGGYPHGNTAEGEDALFDLTTGSENTAIGAVALRNNTSGSGNTASGAVALVNNTTGEKNTATGGSALHNNQTGDRNTATGCEALLVNQTGGYNTATGSQALSKNQGSFNTAMGSQALYNNTTPFFNTAMGFQALYNNTSGGSNIALGFQAGVNLTTGSNNIDIGNAGVAGESGKIRIGAKGTHNAAFIAGISGVAVTGPHVVVSANGKLGVAASSARFKKAIKPMDHASQAIHRLEPVTFRYNEELDPNGIPQFGLVAEEVEKVNADLVVRDEEGKAMSVRYDAVNAMLLNEFLKEHATVQELKKEIATLKAGLQRVSAEIEMNKPTPQLARATN